LIYGAAVVGFLEDGVEGLIVSQNDLAVVGCLQGGAYLDREIDETEQRERGVYE